MSKGNLFDNNGILKEEYYGKRCPGIGVGVLLRVAGLDRHGDPIGDGLVRTLVMRRGMDVRNEPGLLDFPGGGVEMGQDAVDVVAREMLEELGVVLQGVQELFFIQHFPEGQHWVSLTYAAGLAEHSPLPIIREPRKCSELLYLTPDELFALPQDDITSSLELNLGKLRQFRW